MTVNTQHISLNKDVNSNSTKQIQTTQEEQIQKKLHHSQMQQIQEVIQQQAAQATGIGVYLNLMG